MSTKSYLTKLKNNFQNSKLSTSLKTLRQKIKNASNNRLQALVVIVVAIATIIGVISNIDKQTTTDSKSSTSSVKLYSANIPEQISSNQVFTIDIMLDTGGQEVTAFDFELNNQSPESITLLDIATTNDWNVLVDSLESSKVRIAAVVKCTEQDCLSIQGQVKIATLTIETKSFNSDAHISFTNTKISTLNELENQAYPPATITLSPYPTETSTPSPTPSPSPTSNPSTNTAPSISTKNLPQGKVGESYSAQIEATDKNASDTLEITVSQLPEGLSIDNCLSNVVEQQLYKSCVISGTPTSTFFDKITLTVTDSAGNTDSRTVNMRIR